MKEDTITEYHCCSECAKMIEIPTNKPDKFEIGCLDRRGKPNPSGGLTDCLHYHE